MEMKHIWCLFAFLSITWAAPGLDINSGDSKIEIVGGDEADIKDFPYMAALLYNDVQSCGGSLINNDTVVTAAHCIYSISNISELSFRFGSSEWGNGGQVIYANKFYVHEKYDPFADPDYDIAVVKLAQNVTDPIAIPIGLASAGIYPTGTLGVVTGWGLTSMAGEGSLVLRKVEVPVVEESQCRSVYGNVITNRTICAGYDEGGKDSCQDDSGGPYAINGELAGVVSFGNGCALAGYPGVYSSVPTFNEWIRSHAEL